MVIARCSGKIVINMEISDVREAIRDFMAKNDIASSHEFSITPQHIQVIFGQEACVRVGKVELSASPSEDRLGAKKAWTHPSEYDWVNNIKMIFTGSPLCEEDMPFLEGLGNLGVCDVDELSTKEEEAANEPNTGTDI